MKELSGRVAVVTGAASGIGLGMVRAFAGEGMKLVLADIEPEPLERAVAELREAGGEAVGVVTDVARADALRALRDRTLSEYGAVHVLCNNAGVAGNAATPLWALPDDEWDWVLGVNLMGVRHGITAFVPAMLEQGGPGHVVNTASVAGLIHGAGLYGVSKHAVVALSESLWTQLRAVAQGGGPSIGASVLCPGWVRTRILDSERNRPEGPRPDPGPAAPLVEALRERVQGFIEQGLDPAAVGRMVVDAVRDETFYVFTHPHWRHLIEARMATVVEQRDPVGAGVPEQ